MSYLNQRQEIGGGGGGNPSMRLERASLKVILQSFGSTHVNLAKLTIASVFTNEIGDDEDGWMQGPVYLKQTAKVMFRKTGRPWAASFTARCPAENYVHCSFSTWNRQVPLSSCRGWWNFDDLRFARTKACPGRNT